MVLASPSRAFLTAALVHLAAAGALLAAASSDAGALAAVWDAVVWLLLIGFVGCTTLGFSLHLFPAISRRVLPSGPSPWIAFAGVEAGVVGGAAALVVRGSGSGPALGLAAAGLLYAAAVVTVLVPFARAASEPRLRTRGPADRPGDLATLPLFLLAWGAAPSAGVIFALSGVSEGPGFGWWVAAVHLFVLGHATLLVGAISLRLVPRSLESDPPRGVSAGLATLGAAGATLVPLGMLLVPRDAPRLLLALALPEAAFAGLLLVTLLYLGVRARTPRAPFGLHLTGVVFLLAGGGLGLSMVELREYGGLESHALLNVLGFLGLTILIMWFGMIAPFQRISHAWSRRMLWILAGLWVAAVGILALALGSAAPRLAAIGAGLLVAVAVAWALGTLPVLFPSMNPLPGVPSERIDGFRRRRAPGDR